MKIYSIRSALAFSVAGLALSLTTALAELPEDKAVARYEAALAKASKLELPAKAASLVQSVKPEERQAAAIAVLRAVSNLNPAAVPSVVGSITQLDPTLSKATVTEANKLQPKLTTQIQLAAVTESTGSVTPQDQPPPNPVPGPPYKRGHYKDPWHHPPGPFPPKP